MNIHTLYAEFTNDLESYVKHPMQMEPLYTWDPRKVAAPERHAAHGNRANMSTADQIYMLETQNKPFEMIESMVRVFLQAKAYAKLDSIDPVKEQVWLFGYKWLDVYYDLLTEPHVMRSEFYRKEHDKFIGLLGKMLSMSPTQRITFVDALRMWYPSSEYLKDATSVETGVLSVNDDHAKKPQAVSSVPRDCPLPSASSASAPSIPKTRLVLVGSRDPVGHSKTRRNHRN